MTRLIFVIFLIFICTSACFNEKSKCGDIPMPSENIVTVKLGNSVEDILNTLSNINDYQDILNILGERNHKNLSKIQEMDFDTYFISESLYSSNDWKVRLNYIVKENRLGYGTVSSIDSSYINLINETRFFRDDEFLQEYVRKHNDFYKSNYTVSKMLKEIFEENYPIEIGCGNGSKRYGQREIDLFKAISQNDSQHIIDRLKSVNPELQTLGVIGLMKLIERGYVPSVEIVEINDYINNRNSLISACVTCTNGDYLMIDYLSRYQWKKIPNITFN